MKILLFLLVIFSALKASAQDYRITFTGTGAITNVSTVKVENLTAGTSLIINGNDILHLIAIPTGFREIDKQPESKIKIYPNPMLYYSTIEIVPPEAGDATISICDMNGKPLAQYTGYMDNFIQEFLVSGLKNGIYLVNVRSLNYQFTEKLVSIGNYAGSIILQKISSAQISAEKELKKETRALQATVDMQYTDGDRLNYTGVSSIYSTVVMDIPTSDNTINFNFMRCTDGDNNNYPIVQIGTQIWMEENLKTTKYNDGTNIPLVTDGPTWVELISPGYCWYYQFAEIRKYGALYNFYVVDATVNGDKNACPAGWHVPTDEQWLTLTSYLGGESVAGAKLKETGELNWMRPNAGATNESGFTALPGGYRWLNYDGSFYNISTGGVWWSSSGTDNTSSVTYGLNNAAIALHRSSPPKKFGMSIRCLSGENKSLPTLGTTPMSLITQNSVTTGGNVITDGGAAISARGVCWSTSVNPTISNNRTIDGTGIGSFTRMIVGLSAGTTYYVRAYATNIAGTAYTAQISFTTLP